MNEKKLCCDISGFGFLQDIKSINVLDQYYIVEKVIGNGSSSIVFKAKIVTKNPVAQLPRFTVSDSCVVLKIYFKSESTADLDDLFAAESATLLSLRRTLGAHASIITLLDYFVWHPQTNFDLGKNDVLSCFSPNKRYYVAVFQYVEGEDLQRFIRRRFINGKNSDFTPSYMLRRVLSGMLRGLSVLHALGFAHRDIKPSNVLYLKNKAILTDFGLAVHRCFESRSEIPHLLSVWRNIGCGSPRYMSPEQAQRIMKNEQKEEDIEMITTDEAIAGDVWSTALTILSLRHGTFPHQYCSNVAQILCSLHSYDGPPSTLIPDDAVLDAVLRKMLCKDWKLRISACMALEQLETLPSIRGKKRKGDDENDEQVHENLFDDRGEEWHAALPHR